MLDKPARAMDGQGNTLRSRLCSNCLKAHLFSSFPASVSVHHRETNQRKARNDWFYIIWETIFIGHLTTTCYHDMCMYIGLWWFMYVSVCVYHDVLWYCEYVIFVCKNWLGWGICIHSLSKIWDFLTGSVQITCSEKLVGIILGWSWLCLMCLLWSLSIAAMAKWQVDESLWKWQSRRKSCWNHWKLFIICWYFLADFLAFVHASKERKKVETASCKPMQMNKHNQTWLTVYFYQTVLQTLLP